MKKETTKKTAKEVKADSTELVFILDKSGSMGGLETDTVGGFNAMIGKQRKIGGKCLVTTVLFSDSAETLHDRIELADVPALTEEQYSVGGCTALLDAVGGTIRHIRDIHKYARKEDIPSRTVFVITTDGYENASREYTAEKIKKTISEMEAKNKWEFIFLGANIDAVSTAREIGVRASHASGYRADKKGTGALFESVSDAVECLRCSEPLSADWNKKIKEDEASR